MTSTSNSFVSACRRISCSDNWHSSVWLGGVRISETIKSCYKLLNATHSHEKCSRWKSKAWMWGHLSLRCELFGLLLYGWTKLHKFVTKIDWSVVFSLQIIFSVWNVIRKLGVIISLLQEQLPLHKIVLWPWYGARGRLSLDNERKEGPSDMIWQTWTILISQNFIIFKYRR